VAERLLYWFCFGLLGGSVPIAIAAIVTAYRNEPVTATALIGQGELLLVGLTIATPTFGVLFASSAHYRWRAIFSGLVLPGLALVGTLYGLIAASPAPDTHFAVRWSLLIGVPLLVLAALAAALARTSP
jgi:MFS family permease